MNFLCNVLLISNICFMVNNVTSTDTSDDALKYPYNTHSRYRRFDIDSTKCPLYPYGRRPYVKVLAHTQLDDVEQGSNNRNSSDFSLPIVETYHTTVIIGDMSWNQRDVLVHVSYVNNPGKTLSLYEPLHDGTCTEGQYEKATVSQSATQRQCQVAVNAGFFNTTSGQCYGNIVSDGRLVQDSEGLQNAHFGITRDGNLFFGYLSEIDIVAEDFIQLVGGVIWVLRDGNDTVDESIRMECRDTEETGTLQRFASVISARTLVGSDKDGRLMLVQIDGKTDKFGASLYEAATILQKLGAVNAINLDGGGSSTLVINNTVVNYPSDWCGDDFQCSRSVTTILCVHEPYCEPRDCGGHGSCDQGVCHCHGNWKGDKCDYLECPDKCSFHGNCSENGCLCFPGYLGDTCAVLCAEGWFGNQCTQQCQCDNNATCDHVNGSCLCNSGFTGKFCQYRCKYGYYGINCSFTCSCEDNCNCNPVTGSCNYTQSQSDYIQVSSCLTSKLDKQTVLHESMVEEYQSAVITVIVLSVVAGISLLVNCLFMWHWTTKWQRLGKKVKYKRAQTSNNGRTFLFQPSNFSSFTTSSSSEEVETSFTKKKRKLKS